MRLRKRHFVNEFWIHIIILSPSDKLLCCILATSLEYYNKINNQCFMKYYIYIYFIYLIENNVLNKPIINCISIRICLFVFDLLK